MTRKQKESLEAVFDSFSDQIDESQKSYGDCIKAINKWSEASAIASIKSEGK